MGSVSHKISESNRKLFYRKHIYFAQEKEMMSKTAQKEKKRPVQLSKNTY